jgi:hypothetical protein
MKESTKGFEHEELMASGEGGKGKNAKRKLFFCYICMLLSLCWWEGRADCMMLKDIPILRMGAPVSPLIPPRGGMSWVVVE